MRETSYNVVNALLEKKRKKKKKEDTDKPNTASTLRNVKKIFLNVHIPEL